MLSLNADVMGLAETCLNLGNTQTRNQVYDDFKRLWNSHKTTFLQQMSIIKAGTNAEEHFKFPRENYLVGSPHRELMTWANSAGSDSTRLIPNNSLLSPRTGCVRKPRQQLVLRQHFTNKQWRALTKLGQIRPNPRKAFLQDLGLLIDKHQAEGDEIILQLDANTVFNNQEWTDFLESRHLTDLHGVISSDPFPNSFASGTTKIDYMMLGTPKCATAVRRGGIRNFTTNK